MPANPEGSVRRYSLYADVVVTSQEYDAGGNRGGRVPVRRTLCPTGLRANFGRARRREAMTFRISPRAGSRQPRYQAATKEAVRPPAAIPHGRRLRGFIGVLGRRTFTTVNANEKSRTTLPYEPWRSNGSAFCSGVGRTAFPMTQLVTPRLSKSEVRKSLRKSIGKMSLVSLNWLDFLLDIVTQMSL
jgi:hypothetical protein